MCNPRRIRVEATRRLSESWNHEVRRQVRLQGEAVGRAQVRQPLGTVLGGPVLTALERVLEQRDGWREVPEGFRHDLDGGYVVYHVDTRELEAVAELRTQVSAEQEASTQVDGFVEDALQVEGEGRYYDDGWGGLTEQTARRDAERDAQARLEQAAADRVTQARAEAEATAEEDVEARARAGAEAALDQARSAARADLEHAAAQRLEAVGARAQEAFNTVLALAYRDAVLAYARSRRAQGLEMSQTDGVLRIEFEMEA
jgi:hypothetical protein